MQEEALLQVIFRMVQALLSSKAVVSEDVAVAVEVILLSEVIEAMVLSEVCHRHPHLQPSAGVVVVEVVAVVSLTRRKRKK